MYKQIYHNLIIMLNQRLLSNCFSVPGMFKYESTIYLLPIHANCLMSMLSICKSEHDKICGQT